MTSASDTRCSCHLAEGCERSRFLCACACCLNLQEATFAVCSFHALLYVGLHESCPCLLAFPYNTWLCSGLFALFPKMLHHSVAVCATHICGLWFWLGMRVRLSALEDCSFLLFSTWFHFYLSPLEQCMGHN